MNVAPLTNEEARQDRLTRVESILVTQPRPADEKSPYYELARQYELKVDFRNFIDIEPISLKDFRRQKINILEHTAVIFTSRNAVDNYFRLCAESRLEVPAGMKYFCISEQTSNYLHKHITVRKRKIFTGVKTAAEMMDILKKHKNERFLFPCSDVRKNDIPDYMEGNGYRLTEAVMYNTVSSDLSDLSEVFYDVIAFFSPSGIKSLFDNFPAFEQNHTRLAAFGPTTAQAVRAAGLILDIEAPLPNAPSMAGAIELYVKRANQLM